MQEKCSLEIAQLSLEQTPLFSKILNSQIYQSEPVTKMILTERDWSSTGMMHQANQAVI